MDKYGHRGLYVKKTGIQIEKGMCIHHLDGDHYNNVIENLICISRFDHCNYHKALLKAYNPKILKKYTHVEESELLYAAEIINNAIKERHNLINMKKLIEVLSLKERVK